MIFHTIRQQSPDFFTFVLDRFMSKEGSLKSTMTFPACDVDVAFSSMSREPAREASSMSARVWYIIGIVGRIGSAAVERGLALLWAVVVGSGSCL